MLDVTSYIVRSTEKPNQFFGLFSVLGGQYTYSTF